MFPHERVEDTGEATSAQSLEDTYYRVYDGAYPRHPAESGVALLEEPQESSVLAAAESNNTARVRELLEAGETALETGRGRVSGVGNAHAPGSPPIRVDRTALGRRAR